MQKNNSIPSLGTSFLLSAVLGISLFVSACAAKNPDAGTQNQPPLVETKDVLPEAPTSTPQPMDTENPYGEWTEYRNQGISFRFLYPTSWFGPEVDETKDSLRLEVGSDTVYPYGTDRTEQVYTIPDSYYILIEYNPNTSGRSWDDFVSSGWIDAYLALQEMGDGESFSTARSLNIRVREVTLGQFHGLEYIATLSETAQTERFYARAIVAFDEDLNWLRITGFPNMVQIADQDNWKADYSQVDLDNLEVFHTLADSIVIE